MGEFRQSAGIDGRLQAPLFGLSVFLFCIVGILSRPDDGLATIWPANAFMLGMMLRVPRLATLQGWICCACGFFAADAMLGALALENSILDSSAVDTLVVGTIELEKSALRLLVVENLALNSANLLSVGVGYWMLRGSAGEDRDFGHPTAFMHFLRAIVVASLAAGVAGAFIAAWLRSEGIFATEELVFWAATELVNYIALLPVILHFPTRQRVGDLVKFASEPPNWRGLLPALSLLVSAVASIAVGGPGAMAIPVPALLWCALTYDRFWVSCLSFMFIIWTLLAIRNGLLTVGGDFSSRMDVISTRLGVALVALAPMFVAAALAMRNEMTARLRLLAERDALTGLYNRRLFLERGGDFYQRSLQTDQLTAVFMMDLDEFKAVNDEFGHCAGDRVLTRFGAILAAHSDDAVLVGRLGGEEFAAVVQRASEADLGDLAHDILKELNGSVFSDSGARNFRATVSIGIAIAQPLGVNGTAKTFSAMMTAADHAMYRRKAHGRNGYCFAADGDIAYLAQAMRK